MSPRRIRKASPPVSGGGAIDALALALVCAHAADDKKATDIVVLDLRGLADYADFLVIASSRSGKQGRVVAEESASRLATLGIRAVNIHGVDDARWVLCDFGDVIVHVFHESARTYYDLESLWEDAARVEWQTADVDAILGRPAPTGDAPVPVPEEAVATAPEAVEADAED